MLLLRRPIRRKIRQAGPALPPPPPLVVQPPTGLVATGGDTEAILTFNPSATPDIDEYHIEVSTTSGSTGFTEIDTVAGNQTEYTHTGLTNSTQYWWRVRARVGLIYSAYTPSATATPVAVGSGVNAIAPGAMQLFETFDSIGVYLPYADDDNYTATVTLSFKKAVDEDWRDGLPMWRSVGLDEGTQVRFWTGSVVECEHGTLYDVRLQIADSDGVNGSSTITGQVTTRPDSDIPDFAAMLAAPPEDETYPKRYVHPTAGVTTGDGRTPATAWTLTKAMQTDADSGDYLDPVLGVRRMLVELLPGQYDGPFNRTKNSPITLLAQPAVNYTHNADTRLATWDITDTSQHAIIRQPAHRRSAPGENMWELITLNGPGLRGMSAGTPYQCYRWKGTGLATMRHLATSTSQTGGMTDIPVWKRSNNAADPMGSPAGWLEFLQGNLNWNIPLANAFGAYAAADGSIYLRLQGNKTIGHPGFNPNDLHINFSAAGAAGAGFQIRSDNHVYGVHFRGWDSQVRLQTAASRTIVSNCLFHGGRWGVYDLGKKNNPPVPDEYGVHNLVEQCAGFQTSRWRTSTADESSLEWRVVKSKLYTIDETQPPTNRHAEFMESHLTFGSGGSQQRVVRYNLVQGYFNGIAEAQNSTGGWDRWASAYNDCYGNYVRYCPDEAFEPEGQVIEYRCWNNYAEECSLPIGGSPIQWGNVYFWRNRFHMMGNHGTRPPHRTDLPGNTHQPGMAIVKYDGSCLPPGRLHLYHNVVWTNTRPALGGSGTGHHGPFQIGGGGVYNQAWVLANNIFRLTGRIADGHSSPPYSIGNGDVTPGMPISLSWWEDHNFWASAALDLEGIIAQPEMRLEGRGFWTAPSAIGSTQTSYLDEMAGNPAGWKAEHVNVLNAVEYAYTRYDVIDENLADPEGANLTPSSGSLFIDAGKVVPNISDIYDGDAPDMGWIEVE